MSLPSRAQVVVIGGGITGLSTAYHLAAMGWRDVVVLERDQLTSGTTWHAAGLLVSGGMGHETLLAMFQRSYELYSALLEAETGQATGFSPVGYIQLATNPERAELLRRDGRFQRLFGIETHELSVDEVRDHWPLAQLDDVHRGFIFPDQGRVNPVDAAMAFAKGARQRGVTIIEGVEVLDITTSRDRVTGVRTAEGDIEAEHVVICGGLWARSIGRRVGVDIPLQAAEHYYVITEEIAGIDKMTPVLEDPSRYAYYREEVGGLLIGLFEPFAKAWDHERSPRGPFLSLEPDWDRIMPFLDTALGRLTHGHELGIKTFFCGPESFTPDISMLLGEAPTLRNCWVLAGMNSLGILLGGGAGQILAELITTGRSSEDLTHVDPARFRPWENTTRYVRDRVVEQLGALFGDSMWPTWKPSRARNAKRTALHDRLAAAGARFVPVAGWEFPEYFAPLDSDVTSERTMSRQPWFDLHGAEHRACRNDVVLFDMSFMSKLIVQGPDACRVLNHLSVSNVDVEVGRIVYTHWCDDHGTIAADLTISRLAADRFMVVCGPEHHTRVMRLMERATQGDVGVVVFDATSAYGIISLQGPRSRELLATLTDADLRAEHHPHLHQRSIEIGYTPLQAARVTYVGELGYELYVPTESMLEVYERVIDAGPPFGLRHAGLAAMESLRTEKGNIEYGLDIDNTDTPLEVGMRFLIAWDKPEGFRGRQALVTQDAGPLTKRLVRLKLTDPEPLLFGSEPLLRNGEPIGHLRFGTFGHTLGASVGQGMAHCSSGVTTEWLTSGTIEVEVNGSRVGAEASLRPFYDPAALRYRTL